MTMREEFEAWLNGEIEETVGAYEAWCGAYRAGQEAMRERAAQWCIGLTKQESTTSQTPVLEIIGNGLAEGIRALPVE
jgi:hypothetical protein